MVTAGRVVGLISSNTFRTWCGEQMAAYRVVVSVQPDRPSMPTKARPCFLVGRVSKKKKPPEGGFSIQT